MPAIMETAGAMFQAQPSLIQPKHIERVGQMVSAGVARRSRNRRRCSCNWPRFAISAAMSTKPSTSIAICSIAAILTSTQRFVALNNLAFSLAGRKKNLEEALAFINEAGQLFGENSDVSGHPRNGLRGDGRLSEGAGRPERGRADSGSRRR